MSRWYPIQDAPTDGTVVLLSNGRQVYSGSFDDHPFEKSWIACDPSDSWIGVYDPTHWMPLPEPPSVEA